MLVRFRLLFVFLVLAGTTFAQDITGYFDGYYSYSLNKPGARSNAARAFDVNDNEFSLNYAELVINKSPDPFGFRADIGFGDTSKIVHLNEPAGRDLYQYLQQFYVTGTKNQFTVDFGKFVTPIGAEVIETKDNWNYSRGALFFFAIPFYHFGLRTTAVMNDTLTLGASVTNGWNNVQDNNDQKTGGFLVNLKRGRLNFVQQFMFGKEQAESDANGTRLLFDTIISMEANQYLSWMINYDYGTDVTNGRTVEWKGVALYGRLSPLPNLRFAPRFEWLEDTDGFVGVAAGDPAVLKTATLTSQIVINEATSFWGEFRHDWTRYPGVGVPRGPAVFPVNDVGVRDHQSTVAFGLTYSFTRTQ